MTRNAALKLFRASPRSSASFSSRLWPGGCSTLNSSPRWLQARRRTPLRPLERSSMSCPCREWRDVAGSKVRPRDFLKAFVGLALIY